MDWGEDGLVAAEGGESANVGAETRGGLEEGGECEEEAENLEIGASGGEELSGSIGRETGSDLGVAEERVQFSGGERSWVQVEVEGEERELRESAEEETA